MSTILDLTNINLSYAEQNLLNNANLTINQKQKICLLGRNGEGKSTLLKLIAKKIQADSGVYKLTKQQTLGYLAQEIPNDLQGDVFTVVASGLDHVAKIVIDYHKALKSLTENPNDPKIAQQFDNCSQQLEIVDGWNLQKKVNTIISKLNLEPNIEFTKLSGGIKRQVLLAQELVKEPSLLLLDEPTNHLDIGNILWLETLIKNLNCAVLIITHDRDFMQNVSDNILELDRGKLTMWGCDYRNYLRRKAKRDNAESLDNARFDKKLSQEEVWIRQGIKARRTRNEGRVRKLEQMRSELKQRRTVKNRATMKLQQFDNPGKLVLEAENINHEYDGKVIIKDFSLTVARGNKIGIIGANSCGKSTLIKLLLGKIQPQSGTIKLGTNLQLAYFDQLNSALNLEQSVEDNVAGGSSNVFVNGKARHVNSYLQDFLFTPKQARSPAKILSGGERNRLMLAKLFAKPANFLVLDEPTNDLDIETLDLLEELLSNFNGTVLLVSHDRRFLDNVVGSSIIFETNSEIYQSIGGYSDWQNIRSNFVDATKSTPATKISTRANKSLTKKLSFNQQQELKKLPEKIETLEQKITTLQNELAQPDFYQQSSSKIKIFTETLTNLEQKLQDLYNKWQELDSCL